MVFKTLHWYIFRELLRIFAITASALTTLMAFGGMFRPLTKNGIEILQLLSIMMNLMPAMLAYAIPIAALFAAVLVYWRLSTDNELTACRASGISFVTMVMPALVLGLAVASVDLVFVHYVVPIFLQRTEKAVLSDIGSLLVSQITRQENFKIKDYIIYADSAVEKDSPDDPNSVIVVLDGMAATRIKNGKIVRIFNARQALVTITSSTGDTDAQATVKLVDAVAFDEPKLQRVSGSIDTLGRNETLPIPSPLKSKPKFLNLTKLREYQENPASFKPVAEIIEKIGQSLEYQDIAKTLLEQWRSASAAKKPVQYIVPDNVSGMDTLQIYASTASLDTDEQLAYAGLPSRPIKIEQYDPAGKLLFIYRCSQATLNIGSNELSATGLAVTLELSGGVTTRDEVRKIGPNSPIALKEIPGIELPPAVTNTPSYPPRTLLKLAHESTSIALQKRSYDANVEITRLQHTIQSELHSRASFSVSCLTLVLLGAALGILLRGRNPLAVFVVGFVPAIFLVLLITAGRQMAEGVSSKGVPAGLSLIWAGNVILLILVVSVYAKLLRH